MSDQRSVMKEFRFLDEKRAGRGLSPAEEARYLRLRHELGQDPGGGQLKPGFDVHAAAAQLRESLLPAGLRNRPPPPPAPPKPPEPPAAAGLSAADALASAYAARPFQPLDASRAPEAQGLFDPSALTQESTEPAVQYHDQSAGYEPNAQQAWDQGQQWDPNQQWDQGQQWDPAAYQGDPGQQYDPNAQPGWDPAQNQPWDPNQQQWDQGQQWDPAAYQSDPGQQYDPNVQQAWDQGQQGDPNQQGDPGQQADPEQLDPAAAHLEPSAAPQELLPPQEEAAPPPQEASPPPEEAAPPEAVQGEQKEQRETAHSLDELEFDVDEG